ncbi:MAG: ATP-binding protein [Magnetococcales bacterium]|nr:ATP-binding protein [Magnetococcales bacterium]
MLEGRAPDVEQSQFFLEFPISPDYSFSSFVATGENRLVRQEIINFNARSGGCLTLVGEAGTGKTHLLNAAVVLGNKSDVRAPNPQAIYLHPRTLLKQLHDQPKEEDLSILLTRYSHYALVAIDDLDWLEGSQALQEAVLFLFNHIRGLGKKLLLASAIAPQEMAWLREDLRSRLLWGELLTLSAPLDEELGIILEKMAQDRQIRLSPKLIQFLMLRLPRRVPDYARAMAELDRAGMALKKKLTVPLAKKVLNL